MSLQVSVGIPACNEEKNIREVLKRIVNQKIHDSVRIKEIIVVSESEDRTNEIVRNLAREDPRIKLFESARRLGISNAINTFLENARGDILVVVEADTFLEPESIRNLVEPICKKTDVYATSGRKIPISRCSIVRAFWNVHHEFCLIYPKLCGSIMAFRRNIKDEVPRTFFTPDTYTTMVLVKKRLRIVYVPNAKGWTLEPNNLRDFIKQRKRNYILHLMLKRLLKCKPPALQIRLYVKALFNAISNDKKAKVLDYFACAFVEFLSRLLGLIKFRDEWSRCYIWKKVR
jgi:cellulose synthase/poly-beta-1,6-N-acetylglucosamine synthase-like glycosyltransferase